ncbi:MAG: glycosyltransferase family 2 protein [Patescibacteria group bacterium]
MKISAIVLTKNSEELIKDCLESLKWANEIILVDDSSKDQTIEIAKSRGAKVFTFSGDFSKKRNFGAKKAQGEWLLYVDADERVTPFLRKEIQAIVSTPLPVYSGYAIRRRNIFLGREMHWGGWWPDYVVRLMKKDSLLGWEGELHEQPKVEGEIGKLREALTHTSHRSLTEMVDKTNEWSEIEAKLLYKAHHPKMTWWRFLSAGWREFSERGIKKLGFLDGTVGVIEIIYQSFSRMITYAKLWEMQLGEKK